MKELGEILRRAREAKGLSLDQVEQATKIRKVHLCYIEKGERTPGLDQSYFRLFVKTYADFLGLEGAKLLAQYMGSAPGSETAPVAHPQPNVARHSPIRPTVRRNVRVYTMMLMAIAVLSFIVFLVFRLSAPRKPMAPVAQQPAVPGASQPQPSSAQLPVQTSPQVRLVQKSSSATVYEVEGQQIRVKVTIASTLGDDRECWVSVTSDGKEVYQGIFPAGTTLEATATKELQVRSGKPWMTLIMINGVDAGRMGELGPPRNVIVRAK